MSKRQRRRRDERRRHQRLIPSKRKLAAAGGLTAGATLAFAGVAHADTFTVSNLNDEGPGSLRQAILDANGNANGSTVDDIVFASGLSGTIDVGSTVTDGLYPETAMNIQGPGAGAITLKADPSINYVVFTGIYYDGTPGDPITISGLTITGGSAIGENGGGIDNYTASLTVSNDVITGNTTDQNGGGIYSGEAPASLTVIDSTISGNSAAPTTPDSYGGGIFTAGDATIRGSAIFDNSAWDGGGIYSSSNDPNNLTVQRSTIANNHAVSDDAGGIWFGDGDNGEKLLIQNSTVSGNTALNKSGGVEAYIGSGDLAPEVDNTVISGNTSTNDPAYSDAYFEQPADLAFSLITIPPPSDEFNQSVPGSNLLGANPQLGPLQNNGGPSPTEALPATSPAIDKGAAFGANTDQRGVLRPIDFPAIPNSGAAGGDGSDIGAVELQPSTAFKLGKLKRNKKKGTAKQLVILPLPDAGSVTIKGKGLKTKTRQVTGGANLKLPVIAKGKKAKALKRSGKLKVKAQVIYNATGNAATTIKRKLKLLKRV